MSQPIVICGAGIAGIAAAYFLSVRCGVRDILLVDERRPLSLTSDKSTEAYRNWWPGPDDAMLRLMERSIDLLEELADASGNVFHMNRRGYLYATANPERAAALQRSAEVASAMGAGPLRIHDGHSTAAYTPAPAHGFRDVPPGADLITDPALLRRHFGWMAADTVAVLHARRCGWFSGQQLGMWMFEQARAAGVQWTSGRVTGIDTQAGRVAGVVVEREGKEERIAAGTFVNCAGPFARDVGHMLGVDLPLFAEKHLKVAFDDRLCALPRDTGLVIWEDPIVLDWDDATRAELAADPATRWLTEPLPSGVHARPEGHSPESRSVLLLWTYHDAPHPVQFPLPLDADYPEIALRGMSRAVPGLRAYTERLPKMYLDGGYYTKTVENRPLVGPLPVPGAYTLCALSGFGLMAACATGELLAAHVTGAPLPDYARAFLLNRYDDPAYQARLAAWGDTGQL